MGIGLDVCVGGCVLKAFYSHTLIPICCVLHALPSHWSNSFECNHNM